MSVTEYNDSAKASEVIEQALMSYVVVVCHPIFDSGAVGADAWIQLCLRSGVHPESIVKQHAAPLIASWLVHSEDRIIDSTLGGIVDIEDSDVKGWRKASLSAISLFTKVSPASIMSVILPMTIQDLDPKLVADISPYDIEVYNSPEGVLVGAASAATTRGVMDDRPKTEEEKWDLELRRELEAKKGGKVSKVVKSVTPAASKAEREAVRSLLEEESKIRQRLVPLYLF